MKKVNSLICLTLAFLMIIGCAGKQETLFRGYGHRDDYSEDAMKCSRKVVEILDDFNNYNLTVAEAYKAIDECYSRCSFSGKKDSDPKAYILIIDTSLSLAVLTGNYSEVSKSTEDSYNYLLELVEWYFGDL